MPEKTTEEKILDNALAPKRASGEGTSFEQHSIGDQIEADRYQAAKQARNSGLGIRIARYSPPGTQE